MKNNLSDFRMPRWNELPPMDLYLEQVLQFIDHELGDYLNFNNKKILTKTMVNNYVKLRYIEPPVNKKYTRKSVAELIIIALLKPIYSIEEIRLLMLEAMNRSDNEASYNTFCKAMEQAVSHAFHRTSMPKDENPDDPRDLFWNVCNSCACQLYVRNVYLHGAVESDNLKKE